MKDGKVGDLIGWLMFATLVLMLGEHINNTGGDVTDVGKEDAYWFYVGTLVIYLRGIIKADY